jgi:hypothetical protein
MPLCRLTVPSWEAALFLLVAGIGHDHQQEEEEEERNCRVPLQRFDTVEERNVVQLAFASRFSYKTFHNAFAGRFCAPQRSIFL